MTDYIDPQIFDTRALTDEPNTHIDDVAFEIYRGCRVSLLECRAIACDLLAMRNTIRKSDDAPVPETDIDTDTAEAILGAVATLRDH
jgi:hypothetical protein